MTVPAMLLVAVIAFGSLAVSAQEGAGGEARPGPRAEWPQSSPTPPYINAADYGLRPAAMDKLKVEDFGENPDATEALQAALDAGAGGRVYIPPGWYRVTRPLVVQTGTTVMGAGFNATVLLTEQAVPAILHVRRVGGPMTVIRDLWVAGPIGGNWQATGIWLDGCNGVTVRDCWVSALGTGIRVDGISDTWLRNIVFELNQSGIVVQCPELGWASGNLRLIDCYGYQNYGAGITLANCRGVQMQSCSAVGSAYMLRATNCAQMAISGTQVNWDRSPWRKFGLRLEDCDTVTVTGNVVEGMLEYGMAFVRCRHLAVSGNTIRNTTDGPGMIVEGCELGAISGNVVTESGTDGLLISACSHLSLTGNLVDLYGTKADGRAASAGLRLDESNSRCSLSANVVKPVEGGGPAEAIDGKATAQAQP